MAASGEGPRRDGRDKQAREANRKAGPERAEGAQGAGAGARRAGAAALSSPPTTRPHASAQHAPTRERELSPLEGITRLAASPRSDVTENPGAATRQSDANADNLDAFAHTCRPRLLSDLDRHWLRSRGRCRAPSCEDAPRRRRRVGPGAPSSRCSWSRSSPHAPIKSRVPAAPTETASSSASVTSALVAGPPNAAVAMRWPAPRRPPGLQALGSCPRPRCPKPCAACSALALFTAVAQRPRSPPRLRR